MYLIIKFNEIKTNKTFSGGAEVSQLDPVAFSHHYVLWLDIQMNIVLTMDKLDC